MNGRQPPTCRIQPACANCAHAFEIYEYEDEVKWYCTLGALPRPPCMSLAMQEYDAGTSVEERRSAASAWHEWHVGRDVMSHWVCDEHEGNE